MQPCAHACLLLSVWLTFVLQGPPIILARKYLAELKKQFSENPAQHCLPYKHVSVVLQHFHLMFPIFPALQKFVKDPHARGDKVGRSNLIVYTDDLCLTLCMLANTPFS